jgi:hypothetical protein
LAEFIELYEAHEARVLIPSLSPGSFVVRFGEAGIRRILASELPPFFDFWGVLIGDPPRR